ncbi:lipase family protein [Fimbriiglobus ruber]|uniref:Lipase class 3 family protein n=1 Tax=Fimbriiglobus ruber TaxID=1908690 RepID=A0A225DZB0_9BACT|nr:lipase family protein [Fimbriiglobus ruber]OWK43858.1 lipase class 3 family protein [Fimbriiglobus ruber]
MPYQLFEDALGDPRNAAALAAASQFAYSPEDAGAAAFKNDLGMDAKLISVGNTQVYVASNDDHILVAFRGSESPTSIDGLKDWLITNANDLLIQPQGPLSTEFLAAGVGCRWHQGFVNAVSDVWPALFAEVDARQKAKSRCFWVTGHSLGGALAVLGSWLFLRKTMAPHQVYTFGGPMVGNKPVAEALDREFAGKVFRYVNSPDPVPLLPMMSLAANDFLHCEKGIVLGATGEAVNLLAYLKDAAGGVAEGVLSGDIGNKVWEAVKGRVMAHLLNDYRSQLGQ